MSFGTRALFGLPFGLPWDIPRAPFLPPGKSSDKTLDHEGQWCYVAEFKDISSQQYWSLLQDSLIVNLVKPFNVRVVLESKLCPAGEV